MPHVQNLRPLEAGFVEVLQIDGAPQKQSGPVESGSSAAIIVSSSFAMCV